MAEMTLAQLKCHQCNHTFSLNMYRPISEIRCPYCDEEVSSSMINRIREAWGYVADLNRDFDKYNAESDESRFSLNVFTDEVHLSFEDIDD